MEDQCIRYLVQTSWGVIVGEFLGQTVDESGFMMYIGDALQYVRWTDFRGAMKVVA